MRLLPLLALIPFFTLAACQDDAATPDAPPAPPEDTRMTTASGIKYEILKAGEETGAPEAGDEVTVHYIGTHMSGKKFDSSRDRGSPFKFKLGMGEVIAGWDEVVALMTPGAKWQVHIPWKLAYGEGGSPGGIPPRSDLNFEIELLSVKKGVPLPKFRAGDPEKQKKSDSGLVYEELAKGSGVPPRADQGVSLRFALWSKGGSLIVCSEGTGQNLSGACSSVTLGPVPLKFLQEAVLLMSPGSVMRFEVPAALAWEDRTIHPEVPGGSLTIWELELLKVNDMPAFAMSDPDKVTTTASGLQIETVKEGGGKAPVRSDRVTVHYTGWLTDGTVFDSSHARDEPAVFPLGGVIPGWTEALQLMKVGGIARLTIPANLAYGDRQSGLIPPGSTLVFLVELIKIG
ncbi:MAG: FKBP-type peptidylprolyl isomerase [Planctomycetes bacterium]|nr:FKBP-type peptidylprolyl isomerase [Planctomycetota bacterium]